MSIVPAPKDSIEGSPVVRDSDALAGHEQLLSGYRHHDFPHLSSRRFASDTLHTVSDSLRELLRHCSDGNAFISAVITAVARVVGAYCGCQDVLIGVYEEGDLLRPIRVSWDETESWEHVNNAALRALANEKWPRTTPAALRNILGISEKQSPYLALFSIPPLEYTTAHITAPLHVTIHAASSTVSVSASERISHPSQSELFLSQVSALCAHSLNNPHSAVAVLPNLAPYLTSAYEQLSPEQRAIVYGRVPSVKLATDHLGLQATSQPHAIAVRWYSDLSTDQPISSFTPNVITFGDLHRKANQMASWLRQVGLETGVAVAVSMKRDIWFHISLVAILRAGGYYVPIDPELPPERQAFIVRDSNARFVLSSSDLPCYDALGPSALDVSDLEVQATIDAQDSAELELDVVSPDDTAYLLYTSGTTGTPKGCILTHRGLSEATLGLASMCASVEIENCSEANYLSIASVAFDVHLAEIFVPLALGIPILSAPRSLLLEDLPYYIKKLRISHVGIVPSLIEATMGAIQEDEDAGHETTLRYIASGGEKMSDAILDKWASHPKVHLANFYGPSEVTIGCAARFMDRDTPRANIGHTFANVAAFVVDENMNILLRGGAGELVVEGPLVGRGYNGRPDLTEKSFLKFPRDGTDRWAYRTGDLVRMMPDATLEVIGRIDTQIKLRGVRIESEGISSILRNAALSSYTLDAMTILAKHPAIGLEQLVSFVAWDTSVPVSVRKGGIPALVDPPEGLLDQLKVACDRELASYMRPSHIIPLDYIPLSSNGKADAKVLAKVFVELRMNVLTSLMAGGCLRSASGEVFTDITETESKVVEIAKKYIKISVENLLPHANLFECGMDSMVMTQFAAELRRAFGTQISTSNIMKSPVIRDLATLLEDSEFPPLPHDMQYTQRFYSERLEDVSGAYPGSRIEDILPPFPVQEGVLYRSVNAPYMYVQHVLLRCNPDVCVSKLREAWCTVVSRHAMLRAVFYFGRELVQVILHADDCPNQCREKIAPSDDDSDFREFFSSVEASLTATDINEHLSNRPPVRLSFYSTDSSRTTFVVLSIHHALYDGMSLPVLLRDFESAYLGEPALPSAPLSSILNHIGTLSMESARAFWSMYLSNFNWQTMLGRTASSRSADVMTIPFQLSLSDLQLKAARQQVTLQALLMCAFGSLLGNVLYGQDDVVFGVVRSGRSLPVDDIATTICPTITVVPARINFRGSSNILRTVQEDISRVGEFEHIPLGRIQHWVTEGDKSLFETLFSVSFKEHDESVLWRVLESQNPEPDYILAVEVVLDPILDNLVVQAAYTSADISSKVVSRILGDLEAVAVRMGDGDQHTINRVTNGLRSADHKATEALAVGDSETQEEVFVDEELVAQICSIASKFLQIDLTFVKADASLFALGLDSIKSIGLSRKLHVEGITITSADIMRLATPLRLSGFVRQNGRVPRKRDGDQLSKAAFAKECSSLEQALGSDNLRLSEDDQIKVFPTSVLQAGMLSQTVGSAGRRYVHLFPLRLRKSCDIAKLRQAWENATNRFDILRTSFHFISALGIWAQVVHSVPDVKWFNGLYPEDGNLQLLLRHFTDSTDVGDEVFKRPPIYLHLLTDSASRGSLLVLVMHHALYDGISVAKLFDAVLGFYEGHDAVSPVQYHDLLPALMWQEREGSSFWIKCLQDLHNLPIPRKPSGIPAIPSSYHASLVVPVEEGKLKRICGYAAVTLQCIAQSAFAKLLATATGSRDVLFGRVVSGRDLPSAEAVIGPILNTIPCRVRFDDNMSNELLLRTVHEANVAAIPWHHASLRSIQHRLGVSDLWDSIFVFQPLLEAFQSESEPLWEFDTMEEADISIHYPLNLEVHEQSNGFLIEAACAVEVMGIEELQSLLARYAGLLHHIIDHPDQVWSSDLPDIPSTNGLSVVELDDLSDSNDEPIQKDWDSRSLPIRDILSSVTGVDVSKIHLRSHLAALGIDSITAVQIVAKARRAGIRLNASDIVQSRTVDSVLAKARFFEAAKQNGDANQVVIDIPRDQWPAILARFGDNVEGKIEAVTVASPGMQWLIGMWQRSKGSRFQHVFGFRLPGNVEAVRLRSAWEKLLLRHAILRSTFISDNGIPRVVIFKPEGLGTTWMQEDLDTSTNVDIVIQRRMKDLVSFPPSAQEPFTKGVLLSSSEHSCLLVYLHHFQYDAWSLQILVDDLYRLYEGKELVSSNDLQSFLRFSTPHVQARAEQRKYWKTAFPSSYSRVLFPSLRNASTCAPDQRRIVYTLHDAVLGISHLDERARALSVSLQNVFLACWAKVQAAYTSSDLSVFGLWHSGRSGELKDIDRLGVPCINVLPLCVRDVSKHDTMDIAKQVQEDLRNRTALIEQSDLVEVDEWVGGNGQPLCNVFVNIVKIAPDVEKGSYSMFEVIDAPYFIPEVPSDACSEIDDLKVTALTQDDVMIDMVILKDSDKAAMSIEASANVMDIEQAKELVSRWATLVKESLV